MVSGILSCSFALSSSKKFINHLEAAISSGMFFYFIMAFLAAASAMILLYLCKKRSALKNIYRPSNVNAFYGLKAAVIFGCLVFFILGFLSCFRLQINQQSRTIELLSDMKKKDNESILVAEGRICSHVNSFKGGCGFFFKTEKVKTKNINKKSEKIFIINDVLYVIAEMGQGKNFKRDDFLEFSFIPVCSKDNKYLLTGRDNISRLDKTVVKSGIIENTEYLVFKLRQRFYICISKVFYKSLKYEHAAFCEAVILGNKNNLPESIKENFKNSGIYHLLAISGLHISFFIYISSSFILILGRLCRNHVGKKIKSSFVMLAIIIAVVLLYNFITGTSASTVRATFMAIMIIYAGHFCRDYSRKYILSACFICMLVFMPSFFNDIGFWFSFASMFAIIYTNSIYDATLGVLKARLNKRRIVPEDSTAAKKSYFYEIALSTTSVNIFIFPLLVYYFGDFTAIVLPVNIAAVPLFYIIMFILIISSVLGLLWPPAGIASAKMAKYFIDMLLKLSSLWKKLDFVIINVEYFKVWHIMIYYVVLAAILIFLYFVFLKKENKT
ncbi:MAG: ComEC/Rec2 family competence protein [Actinobacteria bacterium]|nr:ComEC/Rec2 family competence protein [Actinomycetota bacterium]